MVRKICVPFLCILLSLCVVQNAAAQSFIASTDKTQIAIGESFTLQLSLKNVTPKGPLELKGIEQDFTLHVQNQSSQTSVANGRLSSSIDWYLTLLPKKEGTLIIPAFKVQTDAGELSTEEITLTVSKQRIATNGQPYQERAIQVETSVNNDNPYQGQPIIFTARLIAVKGITDISLHPLELEGTVTELYEEPVITETVEQGRRITMIEVKYLVTPLVAGKVRIPSFNFKGNIESERNKNMRQSFGGLSIFGAFESYEPFIIGGNPIELDVKPPAMTMDPWLPLQSFEISEEWDGIENAEIGQPITLRIKMHGVGASGASLPNLAKYISGGKAFKTYADKPEFRQEIDNADQTLKGWRQESYTFIPVKAGEVVTPEIKVPWWNVETNKVEYATIPVKTITVDQGDTISPADPQQRETQQDTNVSQNEVEKNAIDAATKAVSPNSTMLYSVIVALAGVSIILLITNIVLFTRLKTLHVRSVQSPSKPTVRKKVSLSEISKVSSAEELKAFIQNYAHTHFEMRENVPLRSIARELKTQSSVFMMIEDMLYRAEKYDLNELKIQAKEALEELGFQAHNKKGERYHSPLNPS